MSVYAGIVLSYLCGAILSELELGFALLFSLLLTIFTLALTFAKRLLLRRSVYAVMLLVGVTVMSHASQPKLNIMDGFIDRYIEAEGIICEVPDEYDEYNSYVIELEKITYLGEELEPDGKIRITSDDRTLNTGNRAAFRGFLKEIAGEENSTDFDYRQYYKSKDIEFQMHADETEIISGRAFFLSPSYLAEYLKSRIGTAIDRFYTNDDAAMIKAVLLGNRSTFSDDFELVLKRTSAIRFLYPSFLHLFFLLSVCELIFAMLQRKRREIAFVIMALLFAVFNGTFITFVRAALMFSAVLLYKRYRGFSDYGDMMAIVLAVCLAANPLLVYNSGFVISMTAGLLINTFRNPVAERLGFIKNRDVRTTVAMWIVTTIGLMPVLAYYLNGAPVYSIIFTLIYTPLCILLYIVAPFALLLYEIFGTASIVGVFVNGIIELMKVIPELVSFLPGHYLTLPKTTIFGFVVTINIFLLLKFLAEGRHKEIKFKAAAVTLAVCFLVHSVNVFSEIGNMYVTFVNVGQGDGAVIDIKGKDTILIDGGGESGASHYNAGEKVFLPYLTAKGYQKIDLAIVSHCHADHIDGIIAAVENLKVQSLLLPDASEESSRHQMLLQAAGKKGTLVQYARAGDRLEFSSGLVIDVLSPTVTSDDENDNSLALKLSYDGTEMFFGGDIGKPVERELSGKVGEVDIVKVSHHGSKNSSSEEFIEETSPRYAVFSAGENNSYGHPAERVVIDFAHEGARILRTDTMNDIIIKCTGEGKIGASWSKEVNG